MLRRPTSPLCSAFPFVNTRNVLNTGRTSLRSLVCAGILRKLIFRRIRPCLLFCLVCKNVPLLSILHPQYTKREVHSHSAQLVHPFVLEFSQFLISRNNKTQSITLQYKTYVYYGWCEYTIIINSTRKSILTGIVDFPREYN